MISDYESFYDDVEKHVKRSVKNIDSLSDVCYVEPQEDNQVNVTFSGNLSFDLFVITKKKLDKLSKEYNYKINYTNLQGDIFGSQN